MDRIEAQYYEMVNEEAIHLEIRQEILKNEIEKISEMTKQMRDNPKPCLIWHKNNSTRCSLELTNCINTISLFIDNQFPTKDVMNINKEIIKIYIAEYGEQKETKNDIALDSEQTDEIFTIIQNKSLFEEWRTQPEKEYKGGITRKDLEKAKELYPKYLQLLEKLIKQ